MWLRVARAVRPSRKREDPHNEPPLRAQLLSAEQMGGHGKYLASTHRTGSGSGPDLLLERLSSNQRVLDDACSLLADAAQADRPLTPAGEWLLDNVYLVEEQIEAARRHLPQGYSRELPRLTSQWHHLPRVYDIALNAISHGDGRVDGDSLSRFVAAYQTVTPLKLGELWAIPIMLRLALIENLRRVSARIIADHTDRNLAGTWADRLDEIDVSNARNLVLVIADMARSQPPLTSSFVAELARRLQGHGAASALPLTWVQQWLADSGHTIEQMVQAQNQQQAADQVSVSNSIGSLRFLSSMDWREFVESMSVVDRSLRADPPGIYALMDFATRDRYRHMVEQIARRGGLLELEVADKALELARSRATSGTNRDIAAHVGYYLIDNGRRELEAALSPRYGVTSTLRKTAYRVPLLAYALPITLIVVFFTQGLLTEAGPIGLAPAWLLAVGLLCVIAFSELGVALVNWAATLLATPRALPRLDYSEGIPSSARTLVVVPTMFGTAQALQALTEALEVRFLANRDANLGFALLTDFFDAAQQVLPGDAALLEAARHEIDALNQRHAGEHGDVFFLFHRPRVWNASERAWMGQERKRGKLAALNAFLRGGTPDAFCCILGNTAALHDVRYVISLDTDTLLPRDSARKLVGTLAHPLNQAVIDPARGVVTRGYGILQPRVDIAMSGKLRTRYARIYGSEPGVDPYTRAVSDVYQDLFEEGSFVGKGIYDIDAFEGSLDGRMPDNCILSHDLLEGCYSRAGLVSDVQLYEEYPSSYAADVKRRHRWIRGDWQLLPWILPRVGRTDGSSERNPLSVLSRLKLLDNLRRSLVPAAMTALLILGWLLAPSPLQWTLWVMSILVIPPLLGSMLELLGRPRGLPLRAHLHQSAVSALRRFARAPLTLASLPFEAVMSLDAIVRTLWRMAVSRRHLLQWSPSSEVDRSLGQGWKSSVRTMWSGPAVAIVVGVVVALLRPQALPVAVPVLLTWLISPLLMWWLSRPRERSTAALSHDQTLFLRRLSRRTWAFFETHVTQDDHWLPPDNVQEHPALVVARRTSPTNIGLSLLADLAAYDFGYVTARETAARCARTMATMDVLPRYRGHFYNWYDTQSLEPLHPRYVSTVDSGNLAGHLLTLRQGLLALADAPVFAPQTLRGIADTCDVLIESTGDSASCDALQALQQELAVSSESLPATLKQATELLARLRGHAENLQPGPTPQVAASLTDESAHWARALLQQCAQAHEDLVAIAAWTDRNDSDGIPSLSDIARWVDESPDARSDGVSRVVADARQRIHELQRLAELAGGFAQQEYGFLYDPDRHLLAIGYNVDDHRRDPGYYDLLASEARLCSFVAIAQGKLPQETWFALGRLLTEVDGDPTLLSWSGSMFEYLMPQLVMPNFEETLLDQTARNSVARQVAYGRQREVPWGVSESGYNLVDTRMNYQYRAFGVPGLGLKRGLAQDLVIAPYASMMALMVAPEPACENLQRLTDDGFAGRFGLYEAIDYTPSRLPRGQTHAVIRSFMVHHQGMGLLSLAYLLCGQPMQRRFVADPQLQATLLLLQERIPRTGVFHPHATEAAGAKPRAEVAEIQLRVFTDPGMARPEVQMLSNGSYHVMLSSAGGGYSRAEGTAVTRWREDATRDDWGSFCYLREVDSGRFWSTTYQPCAVPVDGYEAIFSDAKAEFRGRKHGFESHLEIAVSPEDNVELRRLRITNLGRTAKTIEITSYAEVVLAPAISDELHPAFSNLFVQTELLREQQAIVCTRRARGHDEPSPCMFHLMAVHQAHIDTISYETDRARFVGRGNTLRHPVALAQAGALSGTQGSVLDPIVAIRCSITLAPGDTATVDMVTGIGPALEQCTSLVQKYRDRRLADRVFDLAWSHSQVVRHQINASQADAQLYERLAGLVLYASPALRAESRVLLQNQRGQSGLWGQTISGDHPVVLLQIADASNIELVRQLVQAHAYWRQKGLVVDLVIWNEDQAGYRQQLQDQIVGMVASGIGAHVIDRPGGILVRASQQMAQEDRILIQSVARVILSDTRGSLVQQLSAAPLPVLSPPLLAPSQSSTHAIPEVESWATQEAPQDPWPFDAANEAQILGNGIGAFSADGREYVIDLQEGETTPAPWSNVLANEQFGCVVSESSPGYTWGENAHEFRLTPWHNDPVSDASGEAFYLRDEETGRVWSPMPLPCRGTGAYRIRHGFGYSVYEHVEDGIASELWIYVGPEDAVKYSVLKLHNRSGRPRRLSATGYVEWILGDLHGKTQMHVVTEIDGDSGVLTARNPYNTPFEGRVAFFDTDRRGGAAVRRGSAGDLRHSLTGDRTEFIGRNGNLANPMAMVRERLSGRLGAGLDPCAAIQVLIDLAPQQHEETVFRLGMGRDWGAAVSLATRTRGATAAYDALDAVRMYWLHTLGTIQVQTPEPSVDVLANGWLMYQTIGCRYLARSGYYQSGGAFGFRDQLQDTMAMIHAEPQRARSHLLLSAAHQFPQGDVLHWWHPPLDRGVRTRCSDDYLWLPLAACRYVRTTGDTSVLDEQVRYIDGRAVNADEESYYDLPTKSPLREDLYQHCVRSLQRGMFLLGERGLPLIATGDWNDGMNRVGERGRGESVWLGFFLFDALRCFSELARRRNDAAFADLCLESAERLRQNLEQHAWDGAWYRRAWFDNGAPLGSTASDECRIDSIAQSWSVLSGAGEPARARQAMDSLDQNLVRRDAGLVQLLDPPFDKTPHDPGYIRGYVPGVRENGGQYTHAAIWATMAFAALGDSARAWELLRIINPVHHGDSAAAVAIYKVEPYVVAADVYAVEPHVGRGGWTWYTGSAGWMYRLVVESLLGLQREGDTLRLAPCIPAEWPGYRMSYRFGASIYQIGVQQIESGAPSRLTLDGVDQPRLAFGMVDDGAVHLVEAWIARRPFTDGGDSSGLLLPAASPAAGSSRRSVPAQPTTNP
ncbi:MAG: cyclic beta 1-2 glucan synthetase [Pseudomonadota bacterium]|nr:cyclic beta 1-2 glucan synthetase [Pseudomonadota bacterium]